jgi:hypothetical protein
MDRTGWTSLGALTVLACLLPGCFRCEAVPCPGLPPALTARVFDRRDGTTIPSATINGFPFDCPSSCAVLLPDGGVPYQAGPVPMEVSAPGYKPFSGVIQITSAEIDVNGNGCCQLLYVPQQVNLPLDPL